MPDVIACYKHCPICGVEQRKEFPIEGYMKYKAGHLVQDCFPEMSADDREFLITGICPKCWDSMNTKVAPRVNRKRRELGLTKRKGK